MAIVTQIFASLEVQADAHLGARLYERRGLLHDYFTLDVELGAREVVDGPPGDITLILTPIVVFELDELLGGRLEYCLTWLLLLLLGNCKAYQPNQEAIHKIKMHFCYL